ncbi:hypothetical protein B0H63DRAFT_543331 [Podospora didyma]|uniref:Uncharacterized protein n=1 Tax=Podospora didyma TaxID=330526 RepID=A0AAE0TZF2_9PEZI|nr:hypothetical protein B0H63DRAFT_543331 [Podospora didyma]
MAKINFDDLTVGSIEATIHPSQIIIPSIMSNWAKKQEERGRSTLGVTFSLKDPSKSTWSTAGPSLCSIHPYKDPVHEAKMREIETQSPLQADTSLNCLLHCEMVDNHEKPKNLTLNHHGNSVTRGTTLTDSDDQIDASDIYVHPVSWLKDTGGSGNHTVDGQHSVGLDPENHSSDASVYNAKRYPSAHVEDKCVAYYEFNKTNMKECADHVFDATSHHKHLHRSDASVKVIWESGGNKFHMAGKAICIYDSTWCHTSNFNDEGQACERLMHNISWNFDIILADADNGVLNIIVDKTYKGSNIASLQIVPNKEVQTGVTTPSNQDNEIGAEFQQKLQFVYPGNGTLRFLNPCINRHGNVLAELEYLPYASKGREVIQAPAPHQAALPQIAMPVENPVTVSSGVCAPRQKMTWSTVQTNPAASVLKEMTTAEIKIIAENKTQSYQYFGAFSVTFKSGKGPGNLFNAAQIHGVGAETKGAAQIEPGAESTKKDEETEPHYTVDIETSSGVDNVDRRLGLAQVAQIANSGVILWQATIKAAMNEAIIVPPGGYIALKFYIRTGGEGTYELTVYESFGDENDPTEPPVDAPNPEARAEEAAKKEAAEKAAAEKEKREAAESEGWTLAGYKPSGTSKPVNRNTDDSNGL